MNYKSLLAEIHNAAMASETDAIAVPSNKQLYEVNLNTREIQAPEVLSVQSEHYAETVYFLVDRYYDSMDLAQTNCVIQYVINDQAYIYTVPFCDVTTYENKMIIPWSISISATKEPGTVRFFMRFFLIAEDTIDGSDTSHAEFAYSLSTLTASSRVLRTLPQEDFEAEGSYVVDELSILLDSFNKQVDNSILYWIEADDLV